MTTLILKKCSHCKEEKELINFGKHKQASDGYNCYCKICLTILNKKRYLNEEHKKNIRKNSINWALSNPERTRELNRKTHKKSIGSLNNRYIKHVIRISMKNIKNNDIPVDVIETKRLQLTLARLIKEKQNEQQHRMANNPLLSSVY